jgi:hypothetical protein
LLNIPGNGSGEICRKRTELGFSIRFNGYFGANV